MSDLSSLFVIPKYTEAYASLAKDRIIFVSEEITKEVSSSLTAMLLYFDHQNDNKDISIYINSPGGDAFAMASIISAMEMVKSPIKTICFGKAMSAGSVMLAAGTPGKRFITKNAVVMMHGIQCAFPIPNLDQKSSQVYFDFLASVNKSVLENLAKNTGKSLKQIREDCKSDKYFDANEAKKYGFIDHIIE